ncbi:LamG-like jellyroll fold domain-containing protein [Parapedobacter deserti]|uniref:LamG-like jellyroll fold domain-containing protein n=1 Tax=Parapedobacter deserti TaxID=1912957 RepID=A0ABV7JFU5_9SPHI
MINRYTAIICSFLLVLLNLSCATDDALLQDAPLGAAFEADVQEVKLGDTVRFKDVSEGLPSQWRWLFEGGNPGTAIVHSPMVIYDTIGTFSVTLEVRRDGKISTITIPDFVTVGYRELVADFSADMTTVKVGDPVQFTDLSAGLPESWQWEIYAANGTTVTSTEQHPELTFDRAGIYSVKLTVSHPEGQDMITKEGFVTVLSANPPQADFTSVVSGVVAGGSVAFESVSIGDVSGLRWTFDGGTPATSTEVNPTVVYQTPGRYTVTLEAYDEIGTDTKTVEGHILVVPNSGLVAYYPMDGSGADAGPSAIHPSVIGQVVFENEGRIGGGTAARFDGNSLLLVPDHAGFNFGTGDFTIACWINTESADRMMVWAESGANAGGDNQTWLRLGDNTADRKIRFAVEDASGGTILNISDGVTDGVWRQVVCVREGRVSRVYIDGVLVREGTAPAPRNVSSEQPFKIGAQETSGGGSFSNHFNGLLDDLLVYGRALSEAEVNQLFDLR